VVTEDLIRTSHEGGVGQFEPRTSRSRASTGDLVNPATIAAVSAAHNPEAVMRIVARTPLWANPFLCNWSKPRLPFEMR
jgi:hypothetical protein